MEDPLPDEMLDLMAGQPEDEQLPAPDHLVLLRR